MRVDLDQGLFDRLKMNSARAATGEEMEHPK